MGRYTFFWDYLSTDIINHVEVLTRMMKLEREDDRLLVPVLFYLAQGERRSVTNDLIPSDKDWPKNICRVVEVHKLMQDLRGHEFNIYECAFLDCKTPLIMTAIFSIAVQILLFVALVYNYILTLNALASNNDNNDLTHNALAINNDVLVLIVSVATTVFFAKQAFGQCKNAMGFNKVFRKVGIFQYKNAMRKVLLGFNILINVALGVLITVFNFFFLIQSVDANEAILNSLALFFILELDDTLVPDWDESRIQDVIGYNIHGYIVDESSNVTVELKTPCDNDEMMELLKSDDKVYVDTSHGEDDHSIKVYWRQSSTNYKMFDFHISGNDASDFW
eukprot:CAMPEP_0116131880 /NCGR_PEP_ID=MMETSP0329-20121206/9248_1 /TAXON_ID=697910 /ORGANISM="Pseudo-nitzschia arenysensis, Strain B593" /LENGTH=334 /DNA_ID=CAMNT_0003626353 /DNA_START=346 /DNA_END=1347 /DNA_ORIENTATION=+